MAKLITLIVDFLLAPFWYNTSRLPKKIEAVWVLSGPELRVSGNNGKRIRKGLQVARRHRAAYFIFNGVREQNRQLKRYLAKSKKWMFRIVIFDSNKGRRGNTREQVQTLAARKNLAALQPMVIVSNLPHLPRVKRYLDFFRMLKNQTYLVGVGSLLDKELTIISELRKLIRYSQIGDLRL
ncbi:MAG: hypothetical protein HYS86_04400 [Candidatus Chisholmbacteria bacterium]|nr:hypothetical protein [Candidatus Chisholmbacteria bacterium]